MESIVQTIDGNYHVNDKENNSPSEQRRRKICDVHGPCNGQVSIGRRILVSRHEVRIGRNFPFTAKGKKISGRQIDQVSLKGGKGLVIGKGIHLSEVQTRNNVAGLILFPH